MISARKLERLFDSILDRRPENKERRDFNALNKKFDQVLVELKSVRTELALLRLQPIPNYVIQAIDAASERLEAIVK